jgi:hypothetical protein
MRKLREDSTWNQLTPEQREKLERWLFDENLGYAKTLERVKTEFGIETTATSLCRYYRRRVLERQADELTEAQFSADVLNGTAVDANSLRTATLKLVSKAALNVASEKPQEIEQLVSLTELLLEAEQNDLRRGRLEFDQRCFDYEATVESLRDLPWVRAYMQAIQDDKSLNDHEKIKKVQAMLFHWKTAVQTGKVK